jgi:hypothetical protein
MGNKRGFARCASPAALTALCVLIGGAYGPVWAQEMPISASGAPVQPLSAIDWLSATVTPAAPPAAPNASRAVVPAPPTEPPVTGGLAPDASISTTVLGRPGSFGTQLDGVGLLAPDQTGFTRDLWGQSGAKDVVLAINALQVDSIPALKSLAVSLLLAEAAPPQAGPNPIRAGDVLIARIDKLLSMGALDQAYALIEAAGPATQPDLFRRAFDVSLLAGEEDRACQQMRATRGLDIAAPTRIFCAARAGDWPGANVTLGAELALGGIPPLEGALLSRFLDPEPFGDTPLPAPPKPITPLVWRIYDALGETLPTGPLPLAFAHAELGPRAGWKAQSEAAERLARASVLSPNQLLGIFTSAKPAASGGIWDRIAAFQAFETAYSAQDLPAMNAALPAAYAAAKTAEIEVTFAALFGEGLAALDLSGFDPDVRAMIDELGLLSPAYADLAQKAAPQPPVSSARHELLVGLARGDVASVTPTSALARAVAAGFTNPPLPDDLALLVQSGQQGMGLLAAMSRIQAGIYGEARALTEGLALLRALGQEQAARRTALELMILERRG